MTTVHVKAVFASLEYCVVMIKEDNYYAEDRRLLWCQSVSSGILFRTPRKSMACSKRRQISTYRKDLISCTI